MSGQVYSITAAINGHESTLQHTLYTLQKCSNVLGKG